MRIIYKIRSVPLLFQKYMVFQNFSTHISFFLKIISHKCDRQIFWLNLITTWLNSRWNGSLVITHVVVLYVYKLNSSLRSLRKLRWPTDVAIATYDVNCKATRRRNNRQIHFVAALLQLSACQVVHYLCTIKKQSTCTAPCMVQTTLKR